MYRSKSGSAVHRPDPVVGSEQAETLGVVVTAAIDSEALDHVDGTVVTRDAIRTCFAETGREAELVKLRGASKTIEDLTVSVGLNAGWLTGSPPTVDVSWAAA